LELFSNQPLAHQKFNHAPGQNSGQHCLKNSSHTIGRLTCPRYSSHSFQKQYDTVRDIEGAIHTAIGLLRTRVPDEAFEGAREVRNKVAKWVIAQAYLGFGWLPTYRDNGVDEWSWERVVQAGLVGNEEEEHLLALHPGQYPVSEVSHVAG
jgi:hypothetical protein